MARLPMTLSEAEGHVCCFTARRYDSAIYAATVVIVVCVCVYVSHTGIVSNRLNLRSRKQLHTIAQSL